MCSVSLPSNVTLPLIVTWPGLEPNDRRDVVGAGIHVLRVRAVRHVHRAAGSHHRDAPIDRTLAHNPDSGESVMKACPS